MTNHTEKSCAWFLDLPSWYSERLGDQGLILGHLDCGDKQDLGIIPFEGDWNCYNSTEGCIVVHDQLIIKNALGHEKIIKIPYGIGLSWCFRGDFSDIEKWQDVDCRDFPYPSNIGYYPTIFQAERKLVSYCHCSMNWDGLGSSSIVTIDIEKKTLHNQYWSESWMEIMTEKIPGLEDEGEYWSNGGLQLYLDLNETKLLIHGDDNGNQEASLLFEWNQTEWELQEVIYKEKDINFKYLKEFIKGYNSVNAFKNFSM